MTVEARLKELNLTLPPCPSPAANYAPAVRTGNLLFTAGQTPKKDGKLVFTGKLGADVSDKDGYEAAKLCATNVLSIIRRYAGGLENVARLVKVVVFVNATPEYAAHAAVADGATDLFVAVLGSEGCPARSAVGMGSLPGNCPCEVEAVVELKDASIPPLPA